MKRKVIRRILMDKHYMENAISIYPSERNIHSNLYEQKLRNWKRSQKTLSFPSIFSVKDDGKERFLLNCLLIEQTERWKRGEKDMSFLQRKYWNEKENKQLLLPQYTETSH